MLVPASTDLVVVINNASPSNVGVGEQFRLIVESFSDVLYTTTACVPVALRDDFHGVTAPALPAGWMASNAPNPSGAAPLWATSTVTPDTPLNDASVDDPALVRDKRLDTPNMVIGSAAAQVSFRNFYDLESTFDGGVLEVSSPNINGGTFTDVTDAAVGGSFVTGGYNATISTIFMSPIAGRMAWSGSAGGYINTVANLGPNVAGQTIKLRFRMASDNSVAATGWRIDTILVNDPGACPSPTPTSTPTATPTTPIPTPGGTPTPALTPSPTPAPSPTPTRDRHGQSSPTPTSTPTPCGNYGFTVSSGSIVPGTVDTGNHTDDDSTVIALPFPYSLYDQTFASVSVGSNGHLTFGTVNNAFNPGCIPIADATYAIFPYETDLCTGACTGDTGTNLGIFTSTSGSAPNRIFNIEWRAAYYNSGQTTGIPLNFEVRLFEGQTAFDVIYGTVPPTFTPPSARTLVGRSATDQHNEVYPGRV